jgi:uncharacterized membrane protein YhaH (DUF805 family)
MPVTYDSLFTSSNGRTPRSQFVPALLVLAVAAAFYWHFVKGRTGTFCLLVLVYPGFMLHARRLHDMGRSAWLLAVPVLLLLGMFAVRLKYASFGSQIDRLLPVAALVVAAATALWCAVGAGQTEPNRRVAPAAG